MAGYGDGNFGPTDTLKLNEAVKIGAVIYSLDHDDGYEFNQKSGENWWDCYVTYAIKKGIIQSGDIADYSGEASRGIIAMHL